MCIYFPFVKYPFVIYLLVLEHVQKPSEIKINPRSKSTKLKSTQSNSRTAYRSRVRGYSDSEKIVNE